MRSPGWHRGRSTERCAHRARTAHRRGRRTKTQHPTHTVQHPAIPPLETKRFVSSMLAPSEMSSLVPAASRVGEAAPTVLRRAAPIIIRPTAIRSGLSAADSEVVASDGGCGGALSLVVPGGGGGGTAPAVSGGGGAGVVPLHAVGPPEAVVHSGEWRIAYSLQASKPFWWHVRDPLHVAQTHSHALLPATHWRRA
jgi:hypothetical protein